MATAYAALISLMHIIEQMMEHHARKLIFLSKQQRQIESLQEEVSFLQNLLEVYSDEVSNDAEGLLASRIAMQLLLQKDSNHFSQGLQKVIMTSIDCIRKEVVELKEKGRVEDLLPVVSSQPPNTEKDTMLEYYDEDLEQIMDKLTGQSSKLQIIPIIGMGSIGKTTLARTVYKNPRTVECFYIRAWFTISQKYNLREVMCGLSHEVGVSYDKEEQDSGYHQLGEKLHKHLSGRKYLIVMDDVWSINVWEKLKLFLPDYDNGSRVIITTRLLDVADSSGSSHLYKMKLLDDNKSWSLLCREVFGDDGNCPLELEKTGKDIAEKCKGLPLSVVVIGGLLAKSEMTRKCWEYVSKDINQIVNSENNGHWLKILSSL